MLLVVNSGWWNCSCFLLSSGLYKQFLFISALYEFLHNDLNCLYNLKKNPTVVLLENKFKKLS